MADMKMSTPMRIRTGPVAIEGMLEKTGQRKTEMKNRTAQMTAVRPVRPPSRTAEADSTYVVSADVPSRPPRVLPRPSARSLMRHLLQGTIMAGHR